MHVAMQTLLNRVPIEYTEGFRTPRSVSHPLVMTVIIKLHGTPPSTLSGSSCPMVHAPGGGGGAGTVPEQAPARQTSLVVPASPSSHGVLSGAFVCAEQIPAVQTPATLQGPAEGQTIPAQGPTVGGGGGSGVGGGGGSGVGGGGGDVPVPQSTGATVNVVSPPVPST